VSDENFSMEISDVDDDSSDDSLTASGIAEYIRFNCCPRFFKLKFEGK
jgi:hypothetical protein